MALPASTKATRGSTETRFPTRNGNTLMQRSKSFMANFSSGVYILQMIPIFFLGETNFSYSHFASFAMKTENLLMLWRNIQCIPPFPGRNFKNWRISYLLNLVTFWLSTVSSKHIENKFCVLHFENKILWTCKKGSNFENEFFTEKWFIIILWLLVVTWV